MTTRIKAIITGAATLAVISIGTWEAFKWGVMRVYVPPDKALVITNKFGDSLPAERITVPAGEGRYKGVREEIFGPGRYFFNPVSYDTQLVDLVQIPAGDPHHWDWDPDGHLKDPSTAPMIGLVSLKEGATPPLGVEVVPHEHDDRSAQPWKGIQEEVLTPGTYKINPYRYEVKILPAVVIPAGSVGVVTRLVGSATNVAVARLTDIRARTQGPSTQAAVAAQNAAAPSRLVSAPLERGILKDVLQPGIYYLNPRMAKVTVVPVGYDAITLEHPKSTIRFYSFDGYLIEADFTVVWGRVPADAPNIVANIGDSDRVRTNVIEPAMKAACQNEGAKYTAKELIQGLTRSKFQDDLSSSLEKQVADRNIHVLLALIRNISVKDTMGKDQTEGLLGTIQRANIEIERDLTNKQKTQTAITKAELDQALKLVDVAKETVTSDTGVKVAGILATGQKQAAEIDAQRDLTVAQVQFQVAQLDAQRTQILGKAEADVTRMKQDAEAKGAKLMVDALGSPLAYNQYIFAKNFEPTDLRLIFAGPGTFWTDLKNFQDVGASQLLQQGQEKADANAGPSSNTGRRR